MIHLHSFARKINIPQEVLWFADAWQCFHNNNRFPLRYYSASGLLQYLDAYDKKWKGITTGIIRDWLKDHENHSHEDVIRYEIEVI